MLVAAPKSKPLSGRNRILHSHRCLLVTDSGNNGKIEGASVRRVADLVSQKDGPLSERLISLAFNQTV
jgi:hypothetical protein